MSGEVQIAMGDLLRQLQMPDDARSELVAFITRPVPRFQPRKGSEVPYHDNPVGRYDEATGMVTLDASVVDSLRVFAPRIRRMVNRRMIREASAAAGAERVAADRELVRTVVAQTKAALPDSRTLAAAISAAKRLRDNAGLATLTAAMANHVDAMTQREHERRAARPPHRVPDYAPQPRLCIACNRKQARIDDYCKKCARAAGIVVHGKIGGTS